MMNKKWFCIVVLVLGVSSVAQGEVEWRFKGELATLDGQGNSAGSNFDVAGTDGSITSTQEAGAVVAQFFPRAAAEPVGHTLESGAKVNLQLLGGDDTGFWKLAKVSGLSVATYADTLTVTGSPSFGSYLKFQWSIEGDLNMQLNGGGAMGLGYELGYELFVLTPSNRESVRLDRLRASAGPDDLLPPEFVEPLPFGSWGSQPLSQSQNYNFSGSQATVYVPYEPGTPVDMDFFLATWVSITADALDPGPGVIDGDAAFNNSSTLTALTIVDENFQLIDAPYTIESSSGLTYPIPEPGTFFLLAVALAGTLGRTRQGDPARRHGSGA